MALGSFIFDELKISNSCYMAAAIEFSNCENIQITPCFTSSRGHSSPTSRAMLSWICSSGGSPPSSSNSCGFLSKGRSGPCSKRTTKITAVTDV